MKVEISAEAERDLDHIATYIAQNSPSNALRVLQELRARCLELADLPKSFPLVQWYEHLGVRRRVHDAYLIFYRTETDRVVVLHILHGAMDYDSIL